MMQRADVLRRMRDFWEADAEVYDRSASHGMTEPVEAAAWRAALLRHLPPPPARVLDVGAGTGALSLLAASLGYRVTALDFSPAMLARTETKAAAAGLEIELVVGTALEPPDGPFEAVIERHVIWTQPEPVAALRAWLAVAPSGRLALYEGLIGSPNAFRRARDATTRLLRQAMGIPPGHHGGYGPEVLAALPLWGARTPASFLDVVDAAGWRRSRVERLGDVDWARRMAAGWPLGLLQAIPQFAVVADAAPGPG
jgi:SAM-dependent methyltransferase